MATYKHVHVLGRKAIGYFVFLILFKLPSLFRAPFYVCSFFWSKRWEQTTLAFMKCFIVIGLFIKKKVGDVGVKA